MGCHPDICDIAAATLGLFVKANGITRAIMKLSMVDLACNPILGLTPKLNESGESKRVGRISLCGDGMMRTIAL
jgi:hypothetical protein